MSIDDYRRSLMSSGNLTAEEINELINFKYWAEPVSVDAQARYHFLLFKVEKPSLAEELWGEVKPLLKMVETAGKEIIERICRIFHRYAIEMELCFKGLIYEVNDNGRIRLRAYER